MQTTVLQQRLSQHCFLGTSNFDAVKVGTVQASNLLSISSDIIKQILEYVINGNKNNPSDIDYLNIRSFAFTCAKCYNYVCDFFTLGKISTWMDFVQKGEMALAKSELLMTYEGDLTPLGEKSFSDTRKCCAAPGVIIIIIGGFFAMIAGFSGAILIAIGIAIATVMLAILFQYLGHLINMQVAEEKSKALQYQDVNVL